MNIAQPFKTGEHVIAPSIAALNKQGGSNEDKYVPAVIVFAHPTNGWCSFRYEHSPVTASTFNDCIYHVEDFQKRLENKLSESDEFTDDAEFENGYSESEDGPEETDSEKEPSPGELDDEDESDDEE